VCIRISFRSLCEKILIFKKNFRQKFGIIQCIKFIDLKSINKKSIFCFMQGMASWHLFPFTNIMNYWMDCCFLIGGVCTSTSMLIALNRGRFNILSFYVHRFLRYFLFIIIISCPVFLRQYFKTLLKQIKYYFHSFIYLYIFFYKVDPFVLHNTCIYVDFCGTIRLGT